MHIQNTSSQELIQAGHLPVECISQEIDIYSQQTFGELKKERCTQGLPLFLVACVSNGKTFYFEGSQFVEFFVRHREHKLSVHNPLTREEIGSLVVYQTTPETTTFTPVFDENTVMYHINSLPIILSNPDLPLEERKLYHFMLGQSYRLGDHCDVNIDFAIKYYLQAAELGHEMARYTLVILLGEKGYMRDSLYWTLKGCEDLSIAELSVAKVIEIGNCFERTGYCKEAFPFYHEAACRGNPYGFAKVICYYDRGYASKKQPEMVTFWKQFIPTSYRDQPSEKYLQSLCKLPGIERVTMLMHHRLPEEIKNSHRPLSLPDPTAFPHNLSFFSQLRHFLKI